MSDERTFDDELSGATEEANSPVQRITVRICEREIASCCNKAQPRGDLSSFGSADGLIMPSARYACILKSSYLSKEFALENLWPDRIHNAGRNIFTRLDNEQADDGQDAKISDIVRANLNFLTRCGEHVFAGMVYSKKEDFKFSEGMSFVKAMRLIQASLSRKATKDRPLLHIHKCGEPPRTKADMQFVQHFLMNHKPGYPGVKTRIFLFEGAPYVMSVISTSAFDAFSHPHRAEDVPGKAPCPVSQFVGQPEKIL